MNSLAPGFWFYCPASGVPNIPTASSNQTRMSSVSMPEQIKTRCLYRLTFLSASSHARPVPRSRTPATTKSNTPHVTSFVNCIAINGIRRRIATVSKMPVSLLFCNSINSRSFSLRYKDIKSTLKCKVNG